MGIKYLHPPLLFSFTKYVFNIAWSPKHLALYIKLVCCIHMSQYDFQQKKIITSFNLICIYWKVFNRGLQRSSYCFSISRESVGDVWPQLVTATYKTFIKLVMTYYTASLITASQGGVNRLVQIQNNASVLSLVLSRLHLLTHCYYILIKSAFNMK